jgi:hypothetical protein
MPMNAAEKSFPCREVKQVIDGLVRADDDIKCGTEVKAAHIRFEHGSHEELPRRQGLYAYLLAQQLEG